MNRFLRLSSFPLGLSCAVAALLALAGCQQSQVVPSQGPRDATLPSQVKLYENPPQKYEILGTVTVTRAEGAKWDEKSNANEAFDNAIAKAAKLGANGLLMAAPPGEAQYRANAGYHGNFYQVPVRGKPGNATGVMQAIYVLNE